MSLWEIKGSKSLEGIIPISGSKNATLPILCASILTGGLVNLKNIPALTDVDYTLQILNSLGVTTVFNKEENNLYIDAKELKNIEIDSELASKLRGSFLLAGALLGKYGEVRFPLPGGCNIGVRPIDLHLKAFSSLGAKWHIENGYVVLSGKLKAGTVFLDFPSVGATENAILAAVSIKGKTTILNGAEEPEIVDMIAFLNSLGADIRKEEGKTWVVYGGKTLTGGEYSVMPDRIEAGTWLVLSALTDGKVKVSNLNENELKNVLMKFTEYGYTIVKEDNTFSLKLNTPQAVSFQTGPHPSFPTDMQPQMLTLASLTKGMHIGVETVFENRFQHLPELERMGANYKVFENRMAVLNGVDKLYGTTVSATDLRSGASLVIAGLLAEGTTIIENTYHIERGYENILHKLSLIGADIQKV